MTQAALTPTAAAAANACTRGSQTPCSSRCDLLCGVMQSLLVLLTCHRHLPEDRTLTCLMAAQRLAGHTRGRLTTVSSR